jgi:drug/metabolite transporter (DMT)-like permease
MAGVRDFLRGERVGVAAAILSSAIGGIAGGTTRFAIGASDPVTLGVFRFGVGFLLLLPIALALKVKWPRGRDLRGAIALGVMYFAFFIVLFNLAFRDTTAARGSLALSTLPLLTMLVAAAFGVERLDVRKSIGVIIAIVGVVVALVTDLAQAPPMAWRGDLIMVAATLVMALYNVWSRPFIVRSSPLGYVTTGMGAGSAVLAAIAAGSGSYASVADFGSSQWVAVIYLGAFGGAAAFFLWVFALERTTPTRVAITMTINPVFASAVGALALSEPIGINLAIGLVAVFVGIWIATTEPRNAQVATPVCKGDVPPVR